MPHNNRLKLTARLILDERPQPERSAGCIRPMKGGSEYD